MRERAAYHEAGHIVAAYRLLTEGHNLDDYYIGVTIVPDGDLHGRCLEGPSFRNVPDEAYPDAVLVCAAGMFAELLRFGDVYFGEEEQLYTLKSGIEKVAAPQLIHRQRLEELVTDAWRREIHAVASKLLECETIPWSEAKAIIEEVRATS